MRLDFLFAAPLHIQIHAIAAVAAIVIGLIQILGPKGTPLHKLLGAIWIVLMLAMAGTSAFITHRVAPGDPFWARFSWIHILTIITFYGLIVGIFRLVRGGPKLKKHAFPFIMIYCAGLLLAGAFTLMPGRLVHDMMFGTCHTPYAQSQCESEVPVSD